MAAWKCSLLDKTGQADNNSTFKFWNRKLKEFRELSQTFLHRSKGFAWSLVRYNWDGEFESYSARWKPFICDSMMPDVLWLDDIPPAHLEPGMNPRKYPG